MVIVDMIEIWTKATDNEERIKTLWLVGTNYNGKRNVRGGEAEIDLNQVNHESHIYAALASGQESGPARAQRVPSQTRDSAWRPWSTWTFGSAASLHRLNSAAQMAPGSSSKFDRFSQVHLWFKSILDHACQFRLVYQHKTILSDSEWQNDNVGFLTTLGRIKTMASRRVSFTKWGRY